MFHHRDTSLESGEPPTPPLDDPNLMSSRLLKSELPDSRSASDSGKESRSQSLTGQEQDSGYEASPCSLAGHTSFFNSSMGQSSAAPEEDVDFLALEDDFDPNSSPDDVFEDCTCSFVLLEGAASSMQSSSTSQECSANCDTDESSSFSYQLVPRPSSLPIEIPSHRLRQMTNRTPDSCSPPFWGISPLRGFQFRTHPRSWPSTVAACWGQQSLISASVHQMPIIEVQHIEEIEPPTERRSPLRERSRTWAAEEDGWNFDDTPDVARSMRDEDLLSSRASPLEPLPDLVLQSSYRRSRSASVSLPLPEETIRDVGRRLRRLSYEFEMSRASRNCIPRTPGLAEIRKFFRSS